MWQAELMLSARHPTLHEDTLLRSRSILSLMAIAVLFTGTGVVNAAETGPGNATAAPLPASTHTVFITAHDYSFTGLPAQLPAGWVNFRMINAGRELHMLATFSVPHGYTAATLLDSLLHGHFPPNVQEWGGPNAVAPGDTGVVSLFLPAGQYVAGCFVKSADGKTHFMKGMMGSFEVVGAQGGASPLSYEDTVTLSTYRIAMSGVTLRPGIRTLLVRNAAKERHDVVILKVLSGHSVDDALRWFANVAVGTPAAIPVGGTTALHTGEHAFVNAKLTPGAYVLVCWLTTNNKFHFDLGMTQVFTVPAA